MLVHLLPSDLTACLIFFSTLKAESLQLGFFSSLLGFFDFAEKWYVGMLHNISHKFHPCCTHVGPKNGPIEKCLTAFHKFHVSPMLALRMDI